MYVNSTSCVGINVVPDTTKQTTYTGKEANDKGTSFDDTAVVYSKSQMTTADGTVSVKGVSSDATTSTYAVSSAATTSTTTDYLKSLGTQACFEMQSQLTSLGYYTGAINGNTNSTDFINAVKKFQKDNNLDQTGIVNETTYNKIIGVGKTIQRELSYLGFYEGNINGKLTSTNIKKAIKNFKKVYGLPETSVIESKARTKLHDATIDYMWCMNSKSIDNLFKELDFWKNPTDLDEKEINERDNFAKIWTFLKNSMGLSDKQAAGIMGNLYEESRFCPTNAENSKGYIGMNDPNYKYKVDDTVGYGIMQWTDAVRKTNLVNMAISMGYSKANAYQEGVGDINVQLAHFRNEMLSSYNKQWNGLRSVTSLEASTKIFYTEIERGSANSIEARLNAAKIIYNYMEGNT